MTPNTALDSRTGLPEDLRFLVERYPREVWPDHPNLGEMARFWLQRHDMFRELGHALQSSTAGFREGKVAADEFQGWFTPQLQFFLSQLNTHHHVEEQHYFPLFRAAEHRLAHGFEVLENDHEIIHDAIMASVASANEFLQSMAKGSDAIRPSGDRYADVSDRLLRRLIRHLDDEEDLIIPLILDRSERTLGVG